MEMNTLLPLNMQHGLGSREPVETSSDGLRWALLLAEIMAQAGAPVMRANAGLALQQPPRGFL